VATTKYVLFFALLGVYLTALGVGLGRFGWLLLWPGGSYLVLAAAYAGLGPGVCGKRPDGRLAWWAVLPLFHYLLLTWAVWHLQRLLSREPACNEVVPGLWVGRRPLARELPPGTDLVVDLTAEFPEPRGVVVGRSYVCLPTLDALAPPLAPMRELVKKVAAWPGTALVHCAAGHGRSAAVVAAVLLARGLAASPKEAQQLVRKARPGVSLNRPQRRLLEMLVPEHPAAGPGP
jgi:protein-tyrosine phosphatase